MTKLLHVLLVTLVCISGTYGNKLNCLLKPTDSLQTSWIDMVNPCIELMETQVKIEMLAAMKYLAMGAHFARDTINRPGFSKFFFESASEERQHAIKFIEYLLMRGQLTNSVSKLLEYPLTINNTDPLHQEWESGEKALTEALELETKVTRSIRNIIITCENSETSNSENSENSKTSNSENSKTSFNDYHLVDYLTGEFLEEQYKGQRDLAGKISTLGKMMQTHGALGEFLFDKKLLNGEI